MSFTVTIILHLPICSSFRDKYAENVERYWCVLTHKISFFRYRKSLKFLIRDSKKDCKVEVFIYFDFLFIEAYFRHLTIIFTLCVWSYISLFFYRIFFISRITYHNSSFFSRVLSKTREQKTRRMVDLPLVPFSSAKFKKPTHQETKNAPAA